MIRGAVALAALFALALPLASCGDDGQPPPRGFRADAPPGWTDGTYAAEQHRETEYEVVYEGPAHDGVTSAINVQRVGAEGTPDLQPETERLRAKLRKELGGEPTEARLDKLGNLPALRFDHRVGKTQSRRLVAVSDEWLYVVTLQSSPGAFDEANDALEALQRSWRWI